MGHTRTGEPVVIRCAEEADAEQLVELMAAVVAEQVYTVASSANRQERLYRSVG